MLIPVLKVTNNAFQHGKTEDKNKLVGIKIWNVQGKIIICIQGEEGFNSENGFILHFRKSYEGILARDTYYVGIMDLVEYCPESEGKLVEMTKIWK